MYCDQISILQYTVVLTIVTCCTACPRTALSYHWDVCTFGRSVLSFFPDLPPQASVIEFLPFIYFFQFRTYYFFRAWTRSTFLY